MNTPTTSPPDHEGLRKAVQEFRPNPHRVPFTNLKLVHDSIVELRQEGILFYHCGIAATKWHQDQPGTCGRIRPHCPGRREIAQTAETGENRASHKYPGHASKCASRGRKTHAGHASANRCADGQCHAATKRKLPIPSRGPHIAKVRMMSPEEAKEFNASLKPGNAPKP